MPLPIWSLPANGDRLICVHAGTTLLQNGRAYTVLDSLLDVVPLIELAELRGFLFSPSRFEPAPEPPPADPRHMCA